MESRNEKVMRLIGLVATNGNQFNDLKLEKLLKIVEQPDINIEIDQDGAGAPNEQALRSKGETERTPSRGTKRAPDNSMDSDGGKRKRAESGVSARVVQDLTDDREDENSTGCTCVGICGASCACYRAHGTCERSCSCKGGRGCEPRIKVTKHLFGGHPGIKLTSCFKKEIVRYAVARRNQVHSLVGLSMLAAYSGRRLLTKVEFERNVGELVDLLQSKALAVKNGRVPDFPFKCISGTRGRTALVNWYNKWQSAPTSPTPLNNQLTQELLRYALTDDSSHDCYYSFCNGQWESKSTTRHCEACGKCQRSDFVHCAICEMCFLGSLDWHRRTYHAPGSG